MAGPTPALRSVAAKVVTPPCTTRRPAARLIQAINPEMQCIDEQGVFGRRTDVSEMSLR